MEFKMEQLKPVYNKKTGIAYTPFEKKLLKVIKGDTEYVVEFITSLPRDRMQIRVDKPNAWHKGDILTITGKGIVYSCKVTNVRENRKIIIKKIGENKETNLTPEEQEIIGNT
jgi:hypothetical protein